MSKKSTATATPTKMVRVIAVIDDTQNDGPRTWRLVRGSVPEDSIEVEHFEPEQCKAMVRAHGMAWLDDWDFDRE